MNGRANKYAACLVVAATVAIVLYFLFLGPSLADFAAERGRVAEEPKDLHIALVWPNPESSSFSQGAELAASELNQQGGIVVSGNNGARSARRVKLLTYDENEVAANDEAFGRGAEPPGLRIARQVAENTETLAVIGHDADSVTPATLVYERAGLLFLAPTTSDGVLPRRDSDLVIRMGPSVRQMSEAMVNAASRLSQVRSIKAAVLYPRLAEQRLGDIPAELARHANRIAAERGDAVTLEVAFARTYESDRREHRDLVRALVDVLKQIDVVLIADVLPDAAVIWQEIQDELAVRTGSDVIPVPVVSLDAMEGRFTSIRKVDLSEESRGRFFDELASLVLRESRMQVAILASRTPFGRRLRSWLNTNIELYSLAADMELEVVFNQSFGSQPETHAPLVSDALRHSIDFVFVADRSPAAIALIDRLRGEGFAGPIICPPDLEAAVLRRSHGADARRYAAESKGTTCIVSTFNPQSPHSQVQAFIEKFQDRFNRRPDADAAFGYVAVRLIASGCQLADSVHPRAVAQALRHIDAPDSILGHNQISERGEMLGLEFVLKHADADGNISAIPLGESEVTAPAVVEN